MTSANDSSLDPSVKLAARELLDAILAVANLAAGLLLLITLCATGISLALLLATGEALPFVESHAAWGLALVFVAMLMLDWWGRSQERRQQRREVDQLRINIGRMIEADRAALGERIRTLVSDALSRRGIEKLRNY